MIGRSVLRMNEKFPQHTNLIHRRVLDLGVASIWDMSFPPSQNEIDWKKLINAYQGYRNMKIDFEEFNNIKKKTDQR
jgi:endonuclease I